MQSHKCYIYSDTKKMTRKWSTLYNCGDVLFILSCFFKKKKKWINILIISWHCEPGGRISFIIMVKKYADYSEHMYAYMAWSVFSCGFPVSLEFAIKKRWWNQLQFEKTSEIWLKDFQSFVRWFFRRCRGISEKFHENRFTRRFLASISSLQVKNVQWSSGERLLNMF